jgi:hypothetical protein
MARLDEMDATLAARAVYVGTHTKVAHGWPQVDATPKDGRTETTSSDHLPALAWIQLWQRPPGREWQS